VGTVAFVQFNGLLCTLLMSLIAQRSQVQILPRYQRKCMIRGLVTGNGTRPLIVLDRRLTADGRWRTSVEVTGTHTVSGGVRPSPNRVIRPRLAPGAAD